MKKKKIVKKSSLKTSSSLPNIVSEQETVYEKSTLKKFTSFKVSNENEARINAGISPEKHHANALQLIKSIYADELKKPMDKTLKFRKND